MVEVTDGEHQHRYLVGPVTVKPSWKQAQLQDNKSYAQIQAQAYTSELKKQALLIISGLGLFLLKSSTSKGFPKNSRK